MIEFSEKLLYHIWDAQHLVKNLETVSGKRLRIMFPGQWNSDRGADFRNIIIELNGEVVRGDGEIHLRTYDWKAHNHSEDKNFNSVVLHIVYEHNGQYPQTITENGTTVEILELKKHLDEEVSKLIKRYDSAYHYHPDFCPFFAGMDELTTKLILREMGRERMKKKIKRFAAELFFSDFNQLLYQGIMEAVGYSKNGYNFLQTAIRYPYVDLVKWREEGMTEQEMQAILLIGTGLDEHYPNSIAPEMIEAWSESYQNQEYNRNKINLNWNLFRIRPANHPVHRILQLSSLVYRSLNDSLLNTFIRLFSEPLGDKLTNRIMRNIELEFIGENLSNAHRIGKSRIAVITVNVLLPVIILFGEKMGYHQLREKGWEIYDNYKGLPKNHIEDLISTKYLNEPQRAILRKGAIYQQGVIKLFNDFCHYHHCELCETNKKNLILIM